MTRSGAAKIRAHAETATATASNRSLTWLTIASLIGCAILVWLGTWQIQRLAWKTSLLARIGAAHNAAPRPFGDWLRDHGVGSEKSTTPSDPALEFAYVAVSGRPRSDRESYVFTVRDGHPGYLVFEPFRLARPVGAVRVVFVNVGFVPDRYRDPATRRAKRPDGDRDIRGFVRNPDRGNAFTPEPDRAKRIWYASDIRDMAATLGISSPGMAPVFVEAEAGANPRGWPRGRDGRDLLATIPNRHLSYALTWYGLALALLAVYALYVAKILRGRRKAKT